MAAERPPPKIVITVEEGSGRDDAGGMMPSVLPLTGRRTMEDGGGSRQRLVQGEGLLHLH